MGTNYYRVNIPTEEDIKKMHEMIDNHMFESRRGYWGEDGFIPDDAVTCIQDLIDNCTKSVHICKMSFGWKTCFDHNWGVYYQPNRKSLEEFLSEPNTCIKDEYGEIIPYDKFWKTVDERDVCPRSDGGEPFTSKTYNDWVESQYKHREYICTEDIAKCREKFGIETEENDFEVDGLRFAVYSDFS